MNKKVEKETAVEDRGECYEIMIYMNVRGSICYETRTLCEIITALSITHSCQHGLKKMREVLLISLAFTRHLPHKHLEEPE